MPNERSGAASSIVAAIPLALGLLAGAGDDGAVQPRTLGAVTNTAFDAGPVATTTTARGFLNVYFGNLHSHTSYSDGVEEPDDAFTHARDEGHLDFMAITEHNHAAAGQIATQNSLYLGSDASSLISTANRLTENGRFVALYGQEFSTISSGNHVNVIDVPRVIDVPNGAYDQLVNTWLPANQDSSGGLALLLFNHPATSGSPKSKQYGRDDFASEAEWVRRMSAHAHLIAMINGPSHSTGEGLPPSQAAESEFFRYLDLGFHLAPTADQDNHRSTWGTITNARTAVIADELSKPALLRAMKSRHVYATEDRNLRVVCRVNGQLCGDRISPLPQAGAELTIELTIHDDDEPSAQYEIDVFSDTVGGAVRQPVEVVSVSGNNTTKPFQIQDIRYNGGAQYVFFRIKQLREDGDPERAWTAPVWLEPGTAGPVPTPATDESKLVASRNSQIFHVSLDCRNAQQIKTANRITGPDAKRDRTLHEGCPRQ